MNLSVTNINFEGHKKHKLHLRRKQVKNLRNKEKELAEKCKLLEDNCKALELPLKRVTLLPCVNPKTPVVANLWKLCFDAQYNYIYGSYSKYKESKKLFAKEAVQNLDVLKYVNQPITINGMITPLNKIGRNIIKNRFLDMFRIKTPEEKQLAQYYKDEAKTELMYRALGLK